MNAQSLFIVVNRKSAKIFEISRKPDSLTWLKTMKNPLGDVKNKLLTTDKPGLSRGKYKNNKAPHNLTRERNPHEDVAVTFAKKISLYLKKQQDQDKILNLTVAAEPHMLGLVKKSFDHDQLKTPVKWLRKDLEKLTTERLEAEVFKSSKARLK